MASQPPHYRGFTITLRHTTRGRTPLDECSATTWRPSATFRFLFFFYWQLIIHWRPVIFWVKTQWMYLWGMVLFRASKQYEHDVRNVEVVLGRKNAVGTWRWNIDLCNYWFVFSASFALERKWALQFHLERALQIVVTDKRKVCFSSEMSYKDTLLVNIHW